MNTGTILSAITSDSYVFFSKLPVSNWLLCKYIKLYLVFHHKSSFNLTDGLFKIQVLAYDLFPRTIRVKPDQPVRPMYLQRGSENNLLKVMPSNQKKDLLPESLQRFENTSMHSKLYLLDCMFRQKLD